MTPLSAFLIIALIGALIVIAVLSSPQRIEEKKRLVVIKAKGIGYRALMTDAECELEYRQHKPSVSAAVLNKLNRLQKEYLEKLGIDNFQNCAGVQHFGQYIDGYSLRVRVRKGENYRVICTSYNTSGKFYSIQDTDYPPEAGFVGY